MTSAIIVKLHKRYPGSPGGFSLDLEFMAASGFTILFGPSGAGKTTILDCVAGIVSPDSGRITVGDRVLCDTSSAINLPTAKRHIGYVFQDLALFPHLTILENVEYGLNHLPRRQRRERSSSILGAFRVSALAARKVSEISGGERQRVALARTLVTDPEALLLDEPLAALDASTKSKIISDLRAWNTAHRIPILYVTHSREEVFALGERVIALQGGRIIAEGTPHEVMEAPRWETVAQLAGFENIFDATVESANPERGTMTCQLHTQRIEEQSKVPLNKESVQLETPLVRAEIGASLRIGIRAGDILLAVVSPIGLSARNVIEGHIIALELRDVIISARINCGVELEVHLTLAARDALNLVPGKWVWLIIKTHSCHLMRS
ncbi:MAG TPA: ATP-binding cassette domain-containing protein [Candidatus Sulfotelmatobacter sp.]